MKSFVDKMDVSFIIINYNTDDLTIKAVKSVHEFCKTEKFEIIVVDNDSFKTNLEEELAHFKNTYFYKLDKNIGFGKANNFAFRKAKGDYIFLLNSDAYLIDEDTIQTFVHYLKNNQNVAIVGGNLIDESGKPNIAHGKFLSVDRVLYNYGLRQFSKVYFNEKLATASYCDFLEPTVVDHLTGAAIMIKREVIEKFGLFDTNYFMYLEDMELAYRFKKNGYLSVILPQIKIVHLGGQSVKADKEMRKKIANEIEYSRYIFLQNVTNWPTAFALLVLGKIIGFTRRVKQKIKHISYVC